MILTVKYRSINTTSRLLHYQKQYY